MISAVLDRFRFRSGPLLKEQGRPVGYADRFFSPDTLWLALLSMFWYFVCYQYHRATPGNLENAFMGWFGWADQGAYWRAAQDLASFHLPSAENYLYPLGYPLMGALFFHLLPRHLFLIPNVFFAVGSVLLFYSACKTVFSRKESFGLAFVLMLCSAFVHPHGMMGRLIWENALIVPWNLIPVFFTAFLMIDRLVFRTATSRSILLCSAAAGVAFLCRPPDAVFLFPLFLSGVLDLRTWKERWIAFGQFAGFTGVALGVIVVTKLMVFGTWLSPYDLNVRAIGFSFERFIFKLYLTFFDGMPLHDYSFPMLAVMMPWLLVSFPGLLLFARRYHNPKTLFLFFSMTLCVVIYVSFNALAPTNVYRYHGYRYFAWIFPWLGLFSYFFISRGIRWGGKRFVVISLLVVSLIVVFLGWREVVVASWVEKTGSVAQRPLSVQALFHPEERQYTIQIEMDQPKRVEGIRLYFSRAPFHNMTVAGDWHTLDVLADGHPLALYSKYNPNQRGGNVSLGARNAWGPEGKVQKFVLTFNDTDRPTLERVDLLRADYFPLAFLKRLHSFHD